VQRVLDELGDPLAIAADAGAPAPSPSPAGSRPADAASSRPVSVPGKQPSSVPLLEREWIPMAAIGSFALAGLLTWLGGRLPIIALTLWLLSLVVLLASPLWRPFEKLVGGVAFIQVVTTRPNVHARIGVL
jgi:hypothetical protein